MHLKNGNTSQFAKQGIKWFVQNFGFFFLPQGVLIKQRDERDQPNTFKKKIPASPTGILI